MRSASPAFGRLIPLGSRMELAVSSYLGARKLADVPVVLGSWKLEDAEDQAVPGKLTFSVPNASKWRPTTPGHPLATYGQTLRVRVGQQHSGTTAPEYVAWGWLRLTSAEPVDETIEVEATGLLVNVERARFTKPFDTIRKTSRFAAIASLCKGIIPVTFRGLANETIPAGTWETERLEALTDIVEAWPARKYVEASGTLIVTTAFNDEVTPAPVVQILDGPGGTLIQANAAPVSADDYNAYVVTNQPTDSSAPLRGFAYVSQGPMRWGGPYGFNPGFYSSPVLPANVARLNATAKSLTGRARRRRDTVKVVALPDPRVEIGDVARVRSIAQSIDITGRVTKLELTRTELTLEVAYVGGTR